MLKKRFLAVSALLVFPPLIEGGTTYLPVTIIRLVTLAAVAAWYFSSVREGAFRLERTGLELPIAAFLILAVAAFIPAPYRYLAAQRLISIISYVFILYILFHLIRGVDAPAYLAAAAGMGAFEAATGVIQAHLFGMARAKGTFFNPDFFGCYLAMTAPLTAAAAGHFKGKFLRAACWAAFAVSVYAVLLSQSRGAFAALAVSCVVYFSLRAGVKWGAAVVAASALLLLVTPSLRERAFSGKAADPFSYYRAHIWKNAVERVAERPWGEGLGGYRLGTFRKNFPAPDGPVRYAKVAESAHNGYLQVAVEAGVLALGALLWGVALLMSRGLAVARRPEYGRWPAAAFAGLAGFLAHSLVDSTFMEPALVILALFFAALLLIARPGGCYFCDGKLSERSEFLPAQKIIPVPPPIVFQTKKSVLALYGAAFLFLLLVVFVTMPLLGWLSYQQYAREGNCGPKAARALERAVFFAPGNASYHNALAYCLLSQAKKTNDRGLAWRAYGDVEAASELSPSDPVYATGRGAALEAVSGMAGGAERAGLMEEALKWHLKAVSLNVYNPKSYHMGARACMALGKKREAEALLVKSLEYEPDYLPARLMLARIYEGSGRPGEAMTQINMIKETRARFAPEALAAKGFQADPRELR